MCFVSINKKCYFLGVSLSPGAGSPSSLPSLFRVVPLVPEFSDVLSPAFIASESVVVELPEAEFVLHEKVSAINRINTNSLNLNIFFIMQFFKFI